MNSNEAIQFCNYDKDDPEKVLRVESLSLCQDETIQTLSQAGYICEELND